MRVEGEFARGCSESSPRELYVATGRGLGRCAARDIDNFNIALFRKNAKIETYVVRDVWLFSRSGTVFYARDLRCKSL